MFIDTSGLVCLANVLDPQYQDAQVFLSAATTRLSQSLVLVEFVSITESRGLARPKSLAFLRHFIDDPDVKIVWVDKSLQDSALSLLERQLDKSYSLCDAVSFLLMERRRISEALTTDKHFEQAGFRRLLTGAAR